MTATRAWFFTRRDGHRLRQDPAKIAAGTEKANLGYSRTLCRDQGSLKFTVTRVRKSSAWPSWTRGRKRHCRTAAEAAATS